MKGFQILDFYLGGGYLKLDLTIFANSLNIMTIFEVYSFFYIMNMQIE